MKYISGIFLFLASMPLKAQTLENKSFNYSSGSQSNATYHIQYYVASAFSGNRFNTNNFRYTLGILQPKLFHKTSFNQILDNSLDNIVGPNPFHDMIIIKLNEPDIAIQSILIHDLFGNLIYSEAVHQVGIGFVRQLPIQKIVGNMIIVSILFNVIQDQAWHFKKQFKLIRYE